ncbi:MAG: DUF4317 domain-containing protein [Ruminococcus sp.]|nr:DUF4317 domain-containing protein [Ruminococcus sp.]
MNKKEINEIKKNFKEDSGLFTVQNVVQAFIDAEKNVKYKSVKSFMTLPPEEAELIMQILKKTLSGQIGKNLREYPFPKDAYLEGGMQPYFYDLLRSKLNDEELIDDFIAKICERSAYVSTFAIFAAYCVYSIPKKNKMDEFDDGAEADTDYSFIVTALCPVELRFDGLVFSDENNAIEKKLTADRIIEMPSDGFIFPVFSDRTPDINSVLYYSKSAKKPNTAIVNELLGCEFVMSFDHEKAVFRTILGNVAGDELSYDVITSVNDRLTELAEQKSIETEAATVGSVELGNILWETGLSQQKLEHLPKIFESAMGDKPLTVSNLIDKKTVVSMPSVTVNITKDGQDKVQIREVDGVRSLVIAIDDPEVTINGISASMK